MKGLFLLDGAQKTKETKRLLENGNVVFESGLIFLTYCMFGHGTRGLRQKIIIITGIIINKKNKRFCTEYQSSYKYLHHRYRHLYIFGWRNPTLQE